MSDVRRKHGRLESFLHRLLAGEASRVSWYETCIVDGGPAKGPSHSFVALTDKLLYVIDDPPKRVRAALALGDILTIQMVHEQPLFLRGEDRERTQHIKIAYKIKSALIENNFNPVFGVDTASSRASSCASTVTITDTDSDHKRRKLRKLLSSLSWSKDIKSSTVQVEPFRSASVLDFADSDSLDYNRSTDNYGKISVRRIWPFSALAVGEVFIKDKPHSLDMDSPTSSPISRYSWAQRKRTEAASPDLTSSETSSLISSCATSILPRSHTVLGNYDDHRLGSSNSLFRRSEPKSSFLSMTLHEETGTEGTLHVYILAPQSTFFAHLNGTWQNRLIKETLQLDQDHQNSFKTDGRDHYEQVLQELYRKLLRKSEDSYVLIRQQVERIMKDIGHSTFVKKIFWKDPHLFPAVVNKIYTLVQAPENLEYHTIGYTMDKIKACTSLIRILADLLRHAESSLGSSRHLAYRNGQRTKALVTALVSMPWLPPAHHDVTLTVVTSSDDYASREWESFMEAPLIRSIVDLTNISSMVLHQCFQLSIQSIEENFNQKSKSILWMVKVISEVKTIDTFISRVMCQILFFTGSPDVFPLTSYQSVVLHQQLSLLVIFMSYSTSLALQITLMFGEEIRYFVVGQVIEKRVPSHYPIRPSLLNLVDTLRQAILEKKAGVANVSQLLSFSNTL